MSRDPAVDQWFTELKHPLKPLMQRIRETILRADPRISEQVKYGTVAFACDKDMGSFVQVKDPKRVSLMFNAAGKFKGSYPHLEGKAVKYLRFASDAELAAARDELRRITVEWCNLNRPAR